MRSNGASPIQSLTRALHTVVQNCSSVRGAIVCQADMRESGNAGSLCEERAASTMGRPCDQLDYIAARVLESHEGIDVRCSHRCALPARTRCPGIVEFCTSGIQFRSLANCERGTLIAGTAGNVIPACDHGRRCADRRCRARGVPAQAPKSEWP